MQNDAVKLFSKSYSCVTLSYQLVKGWMGTTKLLFMNFFFFLKIQVNV